MPESTLTSPVTLLDRTLFGEIQLYDDHVVVTGWTWTGPLHEEIPIREIIVFETWAGGKGDNYFRIRRNEGASVRGEIGAGIGLWEVQMEADERIDLKRQHRRHGCTVSSRREIIW